MSTNLEIKPKRGRKKKVVESVVVEAAPLLVNEKTTQYTEEQKAFIEADIKASIILRACAGSGKTHSAVQRVKYLIQKGVDPKKILFLSYTVAAVTEFKKRLNNEDVKICTIHSLCSSMLSRLKKYKNIVNEYDFINYYKEKFKPRYNDDEQTKDEYYELINQMYDDAQYIGSSFAAYKLQTADKIKCPMPKFYNEYRQFMKETKSRDFSDLLIEVRDLLKDNRWLTLFKGQYEHILCDEFQDTSTIQASIILALNPSCITLIGDISQSIYLYSGANAQKVMDMVRSRRKCIDMTLSINFRSDKLIIENSNLYSNLQAISNSSNEGTVHKDIIIFEELVELLKKKPEVAVLARTNSVLRLIEFQLMMRKIPFRYINYLTKSECESFKKAEQRPSTMKKIKKLLPVFKTADNIIQFIEENQTQKSFATSIHKSKGLEWEVVVVVNSISPEILEFNKLDNLDNKTKKEISFFNDAPDDDVENFEARNVHYVAISRPKNELFYMVMGI